MTSLTSAKARPQARSRNSQPRRDNDSPDHRSPTNETQPLRDTTSAETTADELHHGHPQAGGLGDDRAPVTGGHRAVAAGRAGRAVAMKAPQAATASELKPQERERRGRPDIGGGGGEGGHRGFLP